MNLLRINENTFEIEIVPELLVTKNFKEIWERDKSSDRAIAKAELAFIYYMSDVTSLYFVIDDVVTRQKQILDDGIIPELSDNDKWKPDVKVLACIKYVQEVQENDEIIATFKTARRTVGKMRNYLETLDFTKTTKQGSLLNDPKTVSSVLKDLRNLTKELRQAEIDVYTNQSKEEEFIGNQQKSYLEE